MAYTLEQIYEALGKIENGGTDGALKNLIATLTALQNAGGALSTLDTQMNGLKFQSTLLMRGATSSRQSSHLENPISIHAPHARSDLSASLGINPTTISIHAPHARSDLTSLALPGKPAISIHAPHARSDLAANCLNFPL